MSTLPELLKLPEKQEQDRPFFAVIPTPGFDLITHRSGLHRDTRLRLIAAAVMYEAGVAERIIVGGGRLRKMTDSFANLMEKELLRLGIPQTAIVKETHTIDTATQVEWVKENLADKTGNFAFITDSGQKEHLQELLEGYELNQTLIITDEELITKLPGNTKHFESFYQRLHKSPEWFRWQIREKLLAIFTRRIDPKGEKIRLLTQARRQN